MNLIDDYEKFWAAEDGKRPMPATEDGHVKSAILLDEKPELVLYQALSMLPVRAETEHADVISKRARGEEVDERLSYGRIISESMLQVYRTNPGEDGKVNPEIIPRRELLDIDFRTLLDLFMTKKVFITLNSMDRCYKCDKTTRLMFAVVKDELIIVSTDPECFSQTKQEFTFKVKKGDTVLMGDWLGALPRNVPGHPSLNTIKGSFDTYAYYNTFNAVNFGVGNSCPTVYRRGDDFSFGIRGEGEGWEDIGSICTDLWAVTIMTERDIDRIEKDTGEKAQKDRAGVQFEATEDMVFEVTYDHTVSSWDWEVDEETEEYIGKPFATMKRVK